jgi:hypothetical protein
MSLSKSKRDIIRLRRNVMSQFAGDYEGKITPRGGTPETAHFRITDLSEGKVRVAFERADLGSTDDGRIWSNNISFTITVGTKKTDYSGTISTNCSAFPGKTRCIDGMYRDDAKDASKRGADRADDGGWTGGQPRN